MMMALAVKAKRKLLFATLFQNFFSNLVRQHPFLKIFNTQNAFTFFNGINFNCTKRDSVVHFRD